MVVNCLYRVLSLCVLSSMVMALNSSHLLSFAISSNYNDYFVETASSEDEQSENTSLYDIEDIYEEGMITVYI